MSGRLTLGPLLLHWPAETWRDFYLRIAEEAPVDTVCLGEVVCPKRPGPGAHFEEVVQRLQSAGKEVVYSTPALVAGPEDMAAVEALAARGDGLVEANDVAALDVLEGRAHAIGPTINVYNEATLARLGAHGAVRVSPPAELTAETLAVLAAEGAAEIEVQVFGRWPLAISARCYHARAYGRRKQTCQFVCGRDPDGLKVETLDGEAFLTVNGVQTQSHAYGCLLAEVPALLAMGVGGFRLSPQYLDMVAVAWLAREVLDGEREPAAAEAALAGLAGGVPLANGFFHGREGAARVAG